MSIAYEKLPYSEADAVVVTEGDRIGDVLPEDDALNAQDNAYNESIHEIKTDAANNQNSIHEAERLMTFIDAESDKLMDNRGMTYPSAVQSVLQRHGISQERYQEAQDVLYGVSSAPSLSPARAIVESLREDKFQEILRVEGIAAAGLQVARNKVRDEIRNPKVG